MAVLPAESRRRRIACNVFVLCLVPFNLRGGVEAVRVSRLEIQGAVRHGGVLVPVNTGNKLIFSLSRQFPSLKHECCVLVPPSWFHYVQCLTVPWFKLYMYCFHGIQSVRVETSNPTLSHSQPST